jgi:thiol-disulfide isomerase/thioredoxin
MKTLLSLFGLLCLLGSPALGQTLRDLDGKARSVPELVAQPGTEAVVLVVWCSHCGSCRGVERDLANYAKEAAPRVKLYCVAPHPTDSPERIRQFLVGQDLDLEVLRDPNQALITGMKIDKTTTAMVYDKSGKLRYLGPFEGAGKGFAADAVSEVLAGQEVTTKTRALKGCPIPAP